MHRDTGICLVIFLPDAETTKEVLTAMKAESVPCGGIYDLKVHDWHTYNYWEHILQYKAVSHDKLPWSGVPESELPQYTKDREQIQRFWTHVINIYQCRLAILSA
jgi:hypothetical protein